MNEYAAKKAIEAADKFKRENGGKESPDLKSLAKAECAKLKNHHDSNGTQAPQWVRNYLVS